MQLSMWMIADGLKEDKCQISICRGLEGIRGARFLAQEEFLQPDIVYIGPTNEYIGDRITSGVICTNQDDCIFVNGQNEQSVFNKLLNLFDLYRSWEETIHTSLQQDSKLQDFLNLSARVICSKAWIVERGGKVCGSINSSCDEIDLFYAGEYGNYVRTEIMGQIEMRSNRHSQRNPFMVPELNLCCCDLYDSAYYVGTLLMETGTHLDPCLLQLAKLLTEYTETWMRRHAERTVLSPDGNMLVQVLRPTPEPACLQDLEQYLQTLGWNRSDEKVLYLIRTVSNRANSSAIEFLRRRFPEAIVSVFGDHVVLLADLNTSGSEKLSDAFTELQYQSPCAIGASYPLVSMDELYQAYRQALLVLSSGLENGRIQSCTNFMPEYICQLVQSQTKTDLSHPSLKMLQAYDAEHGTQLLETLELYLLCEQNQKNTAALMALHRNSLVYRLSKIQSLCQLNLEDPATRIQIILSFLLRSGGHLPDVLEHISSTHQHEREKGDTR